MLFFYKNKGLLVPVYAMGGVLVTTIAAGMLSRNVGGVFTDVQNHYVVATALLLTALWTHLTKDSFYRDRDGNKKKMDELPNEFIFISMKVWAIIFFLLAGAVFFYGVFR